jgi:hypothetical protein
VLPIQGAPEYTSPSPVAVDWRAGQSAGVTDNPGLGGHPQSLSDTIDELKDHNDKYVNWLLLDGGGSSPTLVELCALATAVRNTPYDCKLGTWNADEDLWCYDDAITVKAIDHRMGAPFAQTNWKGLYQPMASTTYGTIYVCVTLDCEEPPEGCNACEGV